MLQPYGLGKSANAHRRCSSKVMRLHASPLGRTTEALLQDWIALTIARGLSFAIVGGLVYETYIVEMTSYDDFRQEQHRHAFGMGPRLPACG